MSAQNCKIARAVGKIGTTKVLIERVPTQLYCRDLPCQPVSIIGIANEGCEYCDRTF